MFTMARLRSPPVILLLLLSANRVLGMMLGSRASKFASSSSIMAIRTSRAVFRHTTRRTSSSCSFHRTAMIMMPEGPEVRTVVNQLQGAVGRRLARVEFLSGRYVIGDKPSGYDSFCRTMMVPSNSDDYFVARDVIREWNCKGKFIYIVFDDGAVASDTATAKNDPDFQRSIWITLGMTGRFVNEQAHQEQQLQAKRNTNHARWCLVLVSPSNETKRVYYYDQRNFGTLKFCLSKRELDAKLASLGPDILEASTTLSDFETALQKSSPDLNVCRFLMNQSKLSGVGNYILAESLYRARIDPFCSIRELVPDDDEDVEGLVTSDHHSGRPRYHRLFATIQAVARESYQSQQPSTADENQLYKAAPFELYCYGRSTCFFGDKVIQHINGPHGRTIWYTEHQLFMPLEDRLRLAAELGSDGGAADDEEEMNDGSNLESPTMSGLDPVACLSQSLVEPTWQVSLSDAMRSPLFCSLAEFLVAERAKGATIYPPQEEIFTSLNLCPLDQVKVVIIGQDPYHGPGQGHGLAFSVKRGVRLPPSLKNIIREAMDDVGIAEPRHGILEHWARQGVLLLNTVMTVRRGEANSHAGKGWEQFTDACIQRVNDHHDGVVFLLWGNPAAKKANIVDPQRHKIIKTSHPSPLGATKTASPFLGSRCFSRANAALTQQGKSPIDWSIL